MARTVGRLTALQVSRIREPGLYPDGGGLYLQVTGQEGDARSWLYRYRHAGRERQMGLGSLSVVSLAEARKKASEARRLRAEGIDPIETRRAQRQRERFDVAKTVTFSLCAEAFIASKSAGWRSRKHEHEWRASLEQHAYPVLGSLPVGGIDTGLVLKVLEPMWTRRTETASRLRGRIETVLDWARVRGHRQGDNPARWRGHLDHLLAARSKVRPVVHHAALPYAELGAFMARLAHETSPAARALEFTILTAARSGETLHASWDEIDLANKIWTIPPERMKAGKEHRVPLSDRALKVLNGLRALASPAEPLVFPGGRARRPLSQMAMRRILAEMDRGDLTVHGFRSSFRDWAAEATHFPSEMVEMALAHAVGSKVEAAYRRGDLFLKRRQLMDAWAKFLARPVGGNVVSLPARAVVTGE
jgi:integrase